MSTGNTNTLAVDTDTREATLHGTAYELQQTIASAASTIKQYAGAKRTHRGYSMTLAEAEATITADGFTPSRSVEWWGRQGGDVDQARGIITEARTTLADVRSKIAECEQIWRDNGRWTRFFLVTNTNGHIHSSLECSTCRETTSYAWLPAISGLTEADAVAQIGPRLCSVCFPSAPVEHRDGELHADREAREAREAEKTAKADAKRAKALTAALFEGDPERYIRNDKGTTTRIGTIAQAKAFIKGSVTWAIGREAGYSHPCYPAHIVTEVAEALAARTGTPVEAILADARKKAEASYRREARR